MNVKFDDFFNIIESFELKKSNSYIMDYNISYNKIFNRLEVHVRFIYGWIKISITTENDYNSGAYKIK